VVVGAERGGPGTGAPPFSGLARAVLRREAQLRDRQAGDPGHDALGRSGIGQERGCLRGVCHGRETFLSLPSTRIVMSMAGCERQMMSHSPGLSNFRTKICPGCMSDESISARLPWTTLCVVSSFSLLRPRNQVVGLEDQVRRSESQILLEDPNHLARPRNG
jgi:hypothetical protein